MRALSLSREQADGQVQGLILQGYTIVNQTPKSITLSKKKEFNWIVAGLGFVFMFIGLFAYLIYYSAKKDDMVVINIQENVQAA